MYNGNGKSRVEFYPLHNTMGFDPSTRSDAYYFLGYIVSKELYRAV